MRVLLVCSEAPAPPMAGAPLRSWGWLRAASRVAKTGVVTFTRNVVEQKEGTRQLETFCDYVASVHAPRTILRRMKDLSTALVSGSPYLIQAAADHRMAEAVSRAVDTWCPDVVQAETVAAAPYLEIPRRRGIPTVYSAHNVESRILAGPAEQAPLWRTANAVKRMRNAEISYARSARAVVAVSEREAQWFRPFNTMVCYIPNAVHLGDYEFVAPSARHGATVVFVGHLRYPPNRDAIQRLRHEIFPAIRRQHPMARCVIAGKSRGRGVERPGADGVTILRNVPNIAEVWRQASVMVCPLRWGAGSPLKLLESAASGVPIVASRVSAEDLMLQPNRDYVPCTTSAEMAEACVRLLEDRARADATAHSARKVVAAKHHWPVFDERIAQLYENLTGHNG